MIDLPNCKKTVAWIDEFVKPLMGSLVMQNAVDGVEAMDVLRGIEDLQVLVKFTIDNAEVIRSVIAGGQRR